MPSDSHAILVASGADRPGVLDDVSMFLAERHAKILESRVSMLRGQFALLLLVRGSESDFDRIRDEIPSLEQQVGIDVALRPAADETAPHDITPLRLRATGHDPAETVHRLSHLMRVLGTNIENIETNTTGTPDAEAGRFELEMELSVPRHTPVVMLRQYVDSLAREIGIECEVNPM
jgi:glycine cleavage system transcriptional repressor